LLIVTSLTLTSGGNSSGNYVLAEVSQTSDWLSGWDYRVQHTISATPGIGVGYCVKIVTHFDDGINQGNEVYLGGNCSTDFSDLRFAHVDGLTLLDYWRESFEVQSHAVFWICLDFDLSVERSIFVYYGNNVPDRSDGEDIFTFFDDFNDDNLDVSKWTDHPDYNSGEINETQGILKVASGYDKSQAVRSVDRSWSSGYGLEARMKWSEFYNCEFGFDERGAFDKPSGANSDAAIAYHRANGQHFMTQNDAATSNKGRSQSLQSYHRIAIHWFESEVRFYIDDELASTHSSTIPEDEMAIWIFCEEACWEIFIDWIFVRPISIQEPSHSIWGEIEYEPTTTSVNPTTTDTTSTTPTSSTTTNATQLNMDNLILLGTISGGFSIAILVTIFFVRSQRKSDFS
jgi:hypothetical protein